jgi:hypothetical protein
MTKEKELDPAFAEEKTLTFSAKDLEGLIANVIAQVTSQQADQTRQLVEAVVKSREPYVSPETQENNRRIKEAMKKQRQQLEANRLADQATCPHIQGSNSQSDFPSPYGLTSMIKHYLDSGEVIGICTNCTKVVRQGDPDYQAIMRKKSGNSMSGAGRRVFADPAKAIRLGQGKKE